MSTSLLETYTILSNALFMITHEYKLKGDAHDEKLKQILVIYKLLNLTIAYGG